MKKFNLFLTAMFYSCLIIQAYSQEIKQYSGEYPNGAGTPGKATYYYYLKGDDRIKSGAFSYTQYIKTTYGYYNAAISGSYKDNYKNGTWVYSITYSDYNTGYDNLYSTGSIKLISNYLDGIPNGNWSYTEINKARSTTLSGWTAYDINPTVSVNANFIKGCLVVIFLCLMNGYI